MQVHAIMKNVPMSAQKMREMVRQIQGLPALQAQAVLKVRAAQVGALCGQDPRLGDCQCREQQQGQAGDVAGERSGGGHGDFHEAFHSQSARLGRADHQAPLPHQNHGFRRVISMGQKTNPIGLRVGVNKDWRSKWYAGKKEFGTLLGRRSQDPRPAEEKAGDGFRAEDSD